MIIAASAGLQENIGWACRSRGSAAASRKKGRAGMHILWSLIVGLVVGALAKLFMPGKDPGGVIITMLLGIAGSLVAGFIGRSFGWYHSGTSGPGIIASVIGAMVLLGIYRLVIRRRGTTTVTR